ncbi:MAG: phosphate acyltransferase PlsX, partial [Planctomycetes bacterium]|nr:phosphate acyltransferase PlsX [Planctomycetota bacterium]
MRIALDAMGGDHAPGEIVRGAVQGALAHPDVTVILVGKQDAINRLLDEDRRPANVRVVHATEEVAMDESPVDAIRKKKDSSLKRAVDLVKGGEAEAAISAGNTGAMVAASTMILRTQPGIQKAGIAAILPTLNGFGVLLDVGANVNAKSLHLYHYALMGTVYARAMFGGDERVSVGLLSIGEEDAKGNELVKETNAIFTQSPLNFVGNVEGGDIFKGKATVVVCEGFVGNVVLKT